MLVAAAILGACSGSSDVDEGPGEEGGSTSSGTGGSTSSGTGGSTSSGTGGSTSSGTGGSTSSGTGGSTSSGTGGGSPGPHTVGGVVGGLFGSGMVLQNNGSDDLPIAADGPFTFPTVSNTSDPYLVTVASQPTAPDQDCSVQDGQGVVGNNDVQNVLVTCQLVDGDGDGVPDLADPFPNDPNNPVTALPNTVYPHTAGGLFTMNVTTYAIHSVGNFTFDSHPGSMTDMAIDQYGVLYGVTFTDLFVCSPAAAACTYLAGLPQTFNGLTMVPPGTINPYLDTLVAIANSGAWYQVMLTGPGQASLTQIGQYGAPYSSSGDAFSILGVGTYAAVDKSGQGSDFIIEVDPTTGAFISEVGPVTGYSSLYGLAGWSGEVYGFDATGAVLRIDLQTSVPTLVASTSNSWWGAAVSTRIPGQ